MATWQLGAMSHSVDGVVDARLENPSAIASRNIPTRCGEKKIGSQPSAISAVKATFLGPMAAM